jgi:uncharacterized membrane protein YgaE (UPF0421/DUF939 family)
MYFRQLAVGAQVALRGSVAAGLSLAIARALGLEEPILALIAAVIVTDRKATETRKLGIRRILSTAIGGLCGVGLSHVFHQSSWEAAIAIFLAMVISTAITQLGDPKLAAYLCALILTTHSEQPLLYAFSRFGETCIGITAAWAISLIPKLIHLDDPVDGSTKS